MPGIFHGVFLIQDRVLRNEPAFLQLSFCTVQQLGQPFRMEGSSQQQQGGYCQNVNAERELLHWTGLKCFAGEVSLAM
ncbi:MAG: hypothetical protein KDA79_22810 [Planctomycetaceae bacterium]|nr:hypothetical protein [Planctomycetaceae bacterium]